MKSFEPGAALGFIGLGNMGSRIALRLLAAGYPVSVYDRNPSKRDALKAKGASSFDNIASLAPSVELVLSCLTDDQAVHEVYYGSEGVLANARTGLVIMEMSTVSPATSSELASRASALGIEVLDVAISGSTPAAELGALTLLAGGNANVFQELLPIFQAIAHKYFHLGAVGAGTTMKLVVNAILGIGMQAIAEAVNLGERAGLNREVLLQVLSQTAVIAPAYSAKFSRVAQNDYSPQFPLAMMNKDFHLISKLAADVQAEMPATAASYQINSEAMVAHGNQDYSVVVKWMQEQATAKISRQSNAG